MVHTSIAVRVRPDPGRASKCPAPFRGLPVQVEVDQTFDESSTQEDVFSSFTAKAIDDILQGKDACVIVYGTPGSGKTHTLVGHAQVTSFAAGIVPQAIEAILSHLQIVPRDKYQLQATLAGLTARQDACIVDLLDPGAPFTPLRETGAAGAAAKLSVMPLDSMDDAHAYLRHGLNCQQQAPSRPSSALANSSPRRKQVQEAGPMHVMFNLELITRPGLPDEHVATLSFVELIGPETKDTFGLNARKPDEALQRQLARSYTALASVLLALRSENTVATPLAPQRQAADLPHVPWRDSPLTKWLRPVLTAIHNLLIIATVDPSTDTAQDTLATLTYVSRFRTPGPGVRISAPLPGQVEWDPPSRPGSTQPPSRRAGAPAGTRHTRSASATPRVSTPPPGAAAGRAGHSGPCHASQSRWQHPDLTPRSQPLTHPSGAQPTVRQGGYPRVDSHDYAAAAAAFPEVSFGGAVPEVGASQSLEMRQMPTAGAFAGRRLGVGEPRSPGTESAGSPRPRKGPCAALAYAFAGAGAVDQDCTMLQGSPPRRPGGVGCAGHAPALDGRGIELMAMLRRRGVGIREEALLEQLLQDFSRATDEANQARAFREHSEQRVSSLEAALEEQAKDRAAAVMVIEQLQKELREARCECVVLTDQRRYFEERAAAAGAPSGCPGQGAGRGDPDAGPGLVPVQELIEARAQAADARAEAFAARQEVQAAEEHAAELVRQLRERMRLLAGAQEAESGGHGAVEPASPRAALETADRGAHAQPKGCVAMLQEALGAVQGLAAVQQQVQQMARTKEEAMRQAEAVQAAGGAKAVASAETAANAAAAEAALERAKCRDLAARVAQLEQECAAATARSSAAAEEAGRYRSTAGELRKQAKQLGGKLAAAEAELQTAHAHERRARQADAAEAELRLERARHSDVEARADATQRELSAAQQQTAELHSLNKALTRELEGVRAELTIAQRAHADAADRCANAEKQMLGTQERALGLERDVAALREADRHRSAELRRGSEAASALRAQRDSVQERLAEVQEHLSRAVADTDRFRAQSSSRDSLLNHMWTFVSAMDQLMKAAKDAADDAPAQSSPGKAVDKAESEAGLPGSWDDPANQERLLSAAASVRAAASPMMKELQEVVQLRAEAEELALARRTSAASEQSLQAHVGQLESQLHHCQAELQQAQQQLEELQPRLAASSRKYEEASAAADASAARLLELQQQHSSSTAQLAAAQSVAEAAAADAAAASHARDAVQELTARLQAAEGELEIREREIAQLVGELQDASAHAADADAAARDAAAQSQQLAVTAAAAQEALERMQAANQELVERYDRKASAAAAEEGRLQAEIEEHRAEAARLQAQAADAERRTRDAAAAAQECDRLRDELEAVTQERRQALERQRTAEADARDARHELERLQEEVRQLESERRSAAADAERLQKERAAAAETRSTLDASFERLDRARERTRAALSSTRTSRTGLSAPAADDATARAIGAVRAASSRSVWSHAVPSSRQETAAQEGAPRRPQSSAGGLTAPPGRWQRAARDGPASNRDPFASAVPARGGAGSQIAFADRLKPDVEARLAGLDPLAKADKRWLDPGSQGLLG